MQNSANTFPVVQASTQHNDQISYPQLLKTLQTYKTQIESLTKTVQDLQKSHNELTTKVNILQSKAKQQQSLQPQFIQISTNIHKSFTEPHSSGRNHIIIGPISSGKTSWINKACGLNMPVGLGDCSTQAKQVAVSRDGKIHLWDCTGINEHFSIFDPNYLNFFHSATRVFVIYYGSVKSCKQMLLVLSKIKPNDTYAIRTKCDMWDHYTKTVEQEIERDKQILQKWGIRIPVLATSAKKPRSFRDNQKFIQLLTSA